MAEVHEVDDIPEDVEDTDDGGAIIKLFEGEEDSPDRNAEFYANIVGDFSEPDLESLCTRLLEDIERDKKARQKREKDYAEAIKRTGLGGEAPGGASFEGASRAVHPMLTEACVDFQARAIKELMPSNGPVRVFIPGDDPPADRLDKAERKKNYMNWQFLIQMPDFRSELEQLLSQLPLAGSQYLRLIWDARRKRPFPQYWPSDDVYIPYAASNFYTAERLTFAEHITKFEFTRRVKSKMYRDIGDVATPTMPDQSAPEKATEKVEGKTDTQVYNEDGLRTVFEVQTYWDGEAENSDEEGGPSYDDNMRPYRISIDEPARKIVAIVRNWEEDDEAFEPMAWAVEFPFIPWRGSGSIGLGQMIGSLSGAATGALRALLDSALANTIPTTIRLKGSNFSGQSKNVDTGQSIEVEGGVEGDDVRKLVMPVPFNEPSPVLMNLLAFCVESGQKVVRTSMEDLPEQAGKNMPVGTTLALIEEGQRVFAAIHLRLFHAMNYVLRILNRLNRMYLDSEDAKNDIGEVLAKRADFDIPLDVVPVADPEIFSDVQRLAQLQVVADRAQAMPTLYNLREVEKRLLERTKIPDPAGLLLPENTPKEQNAVNENAAMSLGRPVAAFPEQDHLAHIQVHVDFSRSEFFGMLPQITPVFMPAFVEHMKEHIVLWYVSAVFEMLEASAEVDENTMKMVLAQHDPETRSELDRTLAAISATILESAAGQALAQIPQVIAEAIQIIQQTRPQPEADPATQTAAETALQVADKQSQTTMGVAQMKEEGAMQREALKAQNAERADQRRLAGEGQREQIRVAAKREEGKDRAAVDLTKIREKLRADKEMEFTRLSAAERQKRLDAANSQAEQAREHAARLTELHTQEQGENERQAAELEVKREINQEDNTTAMRIASAEMASGERVAIETGKGINPSGKK